jgi:PhnB protein
MRIPEGFARVTPYIFAEDANQYMDHLIAALGGEDGGRTMREETLANGIVHFGGASVMISESGRGFPPSRLSLYFYVDDADAAMERAVKAGMEKVMDPADMDYGDRQGGARDSAGNIWWISERLTDAPY